MSKHSGRRTEFAKWRKIYARLDEELEKQKRENAKQNKSKAIDKSGKHEEDLEEEVQL